MENQEQPIENNKSFTKRDVLQVIFLIVLMIAIGALISSIITVYKYKEMLANPMGYSMNNFGINYCNCYDSENKLISIKSINYNNISDVLIPKIEYAEINYSKLNPSFLNISS